MRLQPGPWHCRGRCLDEPIGFALACVAEKEGNPGLGIMGCLGHVNLVVGNVRQCSGEFRWWESGPAALFLIGKIHISLWSERSKEGKIGPVRSWEGFVWMVDKGIHEPGRVQPEHI